MKKKTPKIRTFNVEEIESPDFLKQLNIDELEKLSEDIRKFIIENVSKTGGHLSSNLGSVEAILAMHYVFDSPKDKFLFDVSHQAYTHKILTGRAKDFKNLRKKGGLSGFTSYKERKHDVLETGHSSTTISAACGILEAKEVNKDIGEVVVFIGDGAMENGLAFEGLNYLGSQKNQKLIIILNDNEMSISKNVGRLAKSFSKMRIGKGYSFFKRITPVFLRRALSRLVSALRTFIYGKNLFNELGYKYFGPIDGHNLKELIRYLKYAKNANESVILKINTVKGKGYKFAEDDKDGRWHGVGKFDVETGEIISDKNLSWSQAIANILKEELKENKNIRIISPATLVGTALNEVKKDYNNEVIDVGINEEHACVMASAMARNGIVPIVSIYSTFLQRSYDYLVNDIDRSDTHVIFLIDRAGLVAGDGSTHQGIFDVAMLMPLPNFVICMPSNIQEAKALIDYAINVEKHPIAIRYPKAGINDSANDIVVNKPIWRIVKEISDVNVLTFGDSINDCMEICESENIGLINALFIKPINEEVLFKLNGKKLIIIEEIISHSSLSSYILEKINANSLNINIEIININDYPDIGSREELKKDFNLDKDHIREVIKKLKNK